MNEWCYMKEWLLASVENAVGKKKCGGRGKSWWGEEIKLLILQKKAAFKKWLCSREVEDRNTFWKICKDVKMAVKEAKQRAWDTFGKELQADFYNNSKFFWKKVKGEQKSERVVLKNGSGELIDGAEKTAEWVRSTLRNCIMQVTLRK
jgi:hypothetical protein